VPLGASTAIAHPADFPHTHAPRAKHVRVVRKRHRRYVPVYRPRRRPVVVVTPPPVVIYEEPEVIYERPAPTVIRRRRQEVAVSQPAKRAKKERALLGLGLRISGATLDGEKIGLSSAENPTMGGIGLQLRTRFGKSLGMEFSAEILSGEGDEFEQRTIPVMASLTYHLFPRSRIQPYVLAGAGLHFTRLSYLGGKYNIDSTELAGQLGAGVEIFLTKNFAIHGDLRAQTVFKNLDTQAKIRTDCLNQVGNQVGFCDNIHSADPDDKFNIGLQFQAGASWYF
jgi:hypothetical protein